VIRWQFQLLWPLAVTLFGMSAFALYVFVHTERLYRLKLLLIPAALVAAVFSFAWYGDRLGYGYPAGLPASFEYVAHRAVVEGHRKAWLDVMVVSRKPVEHSARLHRLPWSKPLEDALTQAQQMQRGGGRIELDLAGQGDAYPSFQPRRVLPQDDAPKDPLPDAQVPDLLAPQGRRL
jgi:hypothetical protein